MRTRKYYLSSMDSLSFEQTRECVFVRELHFASGKECFLVRVSPPVIGQGYGLGGQDIEYLVLASRHAGQPVDPIGASPCFVHIARPLNDGVCTKDTLETSDVEVIAWGEVYRTRRDAENHTIERQ